MARGTSALSFTGLLFSALAFAGQLMADVARAAGRVALVIGNASYKQAPLRNPVNDARAMARYPLPDWPMRRVRHTR